MPAPVRFDVIWLIGPLKVSTADAGPIELTSLVSVSVIVFGSANRPTIETSANRALERPHPGALAEVGGAGGCAGAGHERALPTARGCIRPRSGRGRLCAPGLPRAQGGLEDPVAVARLARCCAAEAPAQRAGPLGEERRPHLEDRVGEAELEDRAGDRGEHRLAADLDLLPR